MPISYYWVGYLNTGSLGINSLALILALIIIPAPRHMPKKSCARRNFRLTNRLAWLIVTSACSKEITTVYTRRRHRWGGYITPNDFFDRMQPQRCCGLFFGRLIMQIRYPVTLKKGAPDVDNEPYPIYGTEEEQEAWCIHHQDDVWGWAYMEGNNNERLQ